jgi:hypothetical protein
MLHTLIPEMFLSLRGKWLRKGAIPKTIPQTKTIARPVLRSKIKGAATEAGEATVEVEAMAEAEAIKGKENGTTFFLRIMMTIVQTIAETRKGLRPS